MEDAMNASDESFDLPEMEAEAPEFSEAPGEDDRALVADADWEDAQSLLDGYRRLEGELADTLKVPDEDAGADELSAFYQDVSKSWTPKDGYRFKMPADLPESFPYDQAFAQEAGNWFKEAGLHPDAAQKLHDRWVGKMAEHFSAEEQASSKAAQEQAGRAEAAHMSLIKEYGPPESDGYQNMVARADRAMNALRSAGLDLSGWFAEKGALTAADAHGLQQVADPTAVKLLAFIHHNAFAEDGLSGLAGGGSGGTNPFEKDNPDLRQQSELLERSPERTRQLIASAGRDPRLFGL
ncbi:hypothetical protein FMN50_11540 [Rhodobacterales bacterium]|nr:hypothetical protein FMN50_11540 [Rhodobacterales bacterium]